MDAVEDLPEPPPEAVLISRARKARGLTVADAAAKTRIIKASRWGQIENGYFMKGGRAVATSAGEMQLAHMAFVVGVSPQRLDEVGRSDAAEILREMGQQKGGDERPAEPEPASSATADLPEDPDERLAELIRRGEELFAEIREVLGDREHRRNAS